MERARTAPPLSGAGREMIAGQALAAWFADTAAQKNSVACVEAFGAEFKALPALSRLDEATARSAGDGSEAALAAGRHFLEDISAVEACAKVMIEAALEDPFFRPPLRTASTEIHSGLVLYDRPNLTILLAVMTPDALAAKRAFREGPAALNFGGQRAVYRFLRAGDAVLSIWEAPEITPNFTGDPDLKCRLVERRRIADGEMIELDGRRQSFVIDHAISDLVYLQAISPVGSAPVMADYDSETLAFVGASSADDAASRAGMMLSLLRAMGRTDAAPVFADMLQARHFHARWHAMREFLALDAELALPHLRALAANDPHPDVRAAAAQTLAAFFPAAAREECAPCLA